MLRKQFKNTHTVGALTCQLLMFSFPHVFVTLTLDKLLPAYAPYMYAFATPYHSPLPLTVDCVCVPIAYISPPCSQDKIIVLIWWFWVCVCSHVCPNKHWDEMLL